MKFIAHRNLKTFIGHYLNDMSNVNNAIIFFGLKPQRDLTKDFRFAFMKRNLNL